MTQTMTMLTICYPAVAELAIFDSDGPRPQFLLDSEKLQVVVVGLEPGQQIPTHPETLAVYHFLAGDGVMTVDGAAHAVAPGATLIAPTGATRGMVATSRLTFLAVKSGA